MYVEFPGRILADEFFIAWVSKHPKKIQIMGHLLRIRNNSAQYKGNHNIMISDDFNKVLKDKLIKEEYLLRGSFKEYCLPESLKEIIKDLNEQRIVVSIILSGLPPFKTYLFTAPKNGENYRKNKILNDMMQTVSIKEGEETIEIINDFYRQFTMEREKKRAGVY